MIQVILSFIIVRTGVTPAVQGFKQGFENLKVKSPAILPPQLGGATNDWWHTLHNDSNWHIQLQRPACLEIILIYYSI